MAHGAVVMMDSLLLYKILFKNRTGAEISASGNPAIMSDTLKNNPMNEMKVFGWSKQETTKGKNLFDFSRLVSDGVNAIDYEKQTITVPAKTNNTGYNQTLRDLCPGITPGTYVFSAKRSNPESGNGSYFLEAGLDFTFNTPTELTDALLDNHIAWYNNPNSEVENVISEIQIEIGTEATDYEPYTGGQPSPSPDYPQQIVSAGMKWSAGKNLLNYERLAETSPLIYKVENSMLTVLNSDGRSWDSIPGTFVLKAGTYRTSGDTVEIFKASDNSAISFNHAPFTLAEDTEVKVKVGADGTVFPYISKAMIEAGTKTTNYEPYDGGVPKLYGDKVNVEVCGKNWLHITPFSTKFQSGVTFEYVKPGGIKITGTATENTDSPIFPIELEPGDYYVDRTIVSSIVVVERNGKYIWVNNKTFKILQNDVPKYWYFPILQGDTVNATIYPRICKKEEVPQSLSISTPTGLPAIPVDSDGNYTDANGQRWIADYVDLKRGKYMQRVNSSTLDGDKLKFVAKGNFWNLPQKTIVKPSGYFVLSKYFSKRSFSMNSVYDFIFTTKNQMAGLFETVDELNAFVAKKYKENNPVVLYYFMREPIERDLTPEEIQAYKNLVTYAGTTIVENDAECYMEVSAGGGDSLRAKKLALILGD